MDEPTLEQQADAVRWASQNIRGAFPGVAEDLDAADQTIRRHAELVRLCRELQGAKAEWDAAEDAAGKPFVAVRAAGATALRHKELVERVGYLLSGGPYAGCSGDWDALVAAYRAEPEVAAIGREP